MNSGESSSAGITSNCSTPAARACWRASILISCSVSMCSVTKEMGNQGAARQRGSQEVDDVGIAEKIVEERLDRFGRIGSAELEEDDAEPGFGHDYAICRELSGRDSSLRSE